jgi:hypothetical protein
MTSTMGSHVATAPDNVRGPGYQDIASNLTNVVSRGNVVWRVQGLKSDDMLILFDLGFLSCLTTIAPRSVSKPWHFLNRGLPWLRFRARGAGAARS